MLSSKKFEPVAKAIVITQQRNFGGIQIAKLNEAKSVQTFVNIKIIDSVFPASTFCRWPIVRFRTKAYGRDSQEDRMRATLRLQSGLERKLHGQLMPRDHSISPFARGDIHRPPAPWGLRGTESFADRIS